MAILPLPFFWRQRSANEDGEVGMLILPVINHNGKEYEKDLYVPSKNNAYSLYCDLFLWSLMPNHRTC